MQLVPSLKQSDSKHSSPWRETLVVLLATALAIALSAHFNWSEALYALTRRGERLQLDELPIGVLVLVTGLFWLTWRRNRQARHEVEVQRLTEARLHEALAANRALAKESLRIQEADRKNLARELHDELGQYLNAIKLDAVSIRDGATESGDSVSAASDAIIRTVDHLHGVVSRMIARLRPVALDELGLIAAIEHSVDEWRRRLPNIRFRFESRGEFVDLEEGLSLAAYRVIQEGLTNVCKHARAGNVEIVLERNAAGGHGSETLSVTVRDDGCGTDLEHPSAGYGLIGMRERIELVGGTLTIESAPGKGLRICAQLPCQVEAS